MFSTIAKIAGELGLPILKKVADKHLDGKAKFIADISLSQISKFLDIDISKGDPEGQLNQIYRNNPSLVSNVLRNQEENLKKISEGLGFINEINKTTNETIRQEMIAESLLTRIWRPVFGIVYSLSFLLFFSSFIFAIVSDNIYIINMIAECSGIIISLFGMGASILGVYVWKRSDEKIKSKL